MTKEMEQTETERYIIQLLRINIMFVSTATIILVNMSNIDFFGLKTSIIIGIILVIFVSVLGFIHSAFGFNPAEYLQEKYLG